MEIDKNLVFTNWLEVNGAKLYNLQINTENNDRWVSAKKDVSKGDIILFIPKNLLISYELAAAQCEWIQQIIESKVDLRLPKHSMGSVWLLNECRNETSFYKPFIDVLFDEKYCEQFVRSFPVFFSENELNLLVDTQLFCKLFF